MHCCFCLVWNSALHLHKSTGQSCQSRTDLQLGFRFQSISASARVKPWPGSQVTGSATSRVHGCTTKIVQIFETSKWLWLFVGDYVSFTNKRKNWFIPNDFSNWFIPVKGIQMISPFKMTTLWYPSLEKNGSQGSFASLSRRGSNVWGSVAGPRSHLSTHGWNLVKLSEDTVHAKRVICDLWRKDIRIMCQTLRIVYAKSSQLEQHLPTKFKPRPDSQHSAPYSWNFFFRFWVYCAPSNWNWWTWTFPVDRDRMREE